MGELLICTNCHTWFYSQDDKYDDWRATFGQGIDTEIFCCKKCEDEFRERERKRLSETSSAIDSFISGLRKKL